jgi:hypothetical protein
VQPTCALALPSTAPTSGAVAAIRLNQGVTERLIAELEVATAELKAHIASWEYAFAMAATSYGGSDHPTHEQTRRRTEALQRRCRDLRAQLAEHELDET